MAAVATLEGSGQGSGTATVNVSVSVGASDTHIVASAHTSDATNNGTITHIRWKPTGTPETFTLESDAEWYTNDCRSAFGYLAAPSTGTDTVRLTNSIATDELSFGVWTVTGGTTSAPHTRTAPTAVTGSSSTPSITNANVQSGDAVFYHYSGVEGDLSGSTITISSHNTGQSQGYDQGHPYIGAGGSYEQATGTSESGGATFSESIDYRIISLAIVQGSTATTVSITGVQTTGSTNSLTLSTYALVPLSGLAATGGIGTLSVTTQSGQTVALTGIAMTGQPGSLSATGGSTIMLSGLALSGEVNTTTIIGHAVVDLNGNEITGEIGNLVVVAGGSQTVSLTGLSATGSIGTLSFTTSAALTLISVDAEGQIGLFQIIGGAVTSIDGTQSNVQIGTLTASEQQIIALSGVSLSGAVGILDVTGYASVQVSGVQSDGSIGTITIDTGIDEAVIPGYRINTVETESRRFLILS